MASAIVTLRDVHKWFGKLHVLRGVSLAVESGEVVVICGPSGSGKSTLLRCVNGLERIQEGRLTVMGRTRNPTSATAVLGDPGARHRIHDPREPSRCST